MQQAAYLKQLDKFELENLGNFRRIYPRPGMEHYDKFFHSSGSLFQETAAYKARSEAARWDVNIASFKHSFFNTFLPSFVSDHIETSSCSRSFVMQVTTRRNKTKTRKVRFHIEKEKVGLISTA